MLRRLIENSKKRRRGAVLAEAVSSLALLFPVIVLSLFVMIESTYAYTIARNMKNAAFLAARQLAKEYKSYNGITSDTAAQDAIYSQIRIPLMVTGNAQFSVPSGGWQTGANPPSVTVEVRYLSGQGSPALPQFPHPGILNLGNNYVVAARASYCLN